MRSASASPYGLRSSRTQHFPLNLQRSGGWARLNCRSGPNQVAKSIAALLDQDKEIESNLALVAGVDTSAAVGFRNQLMADKLLLGIDIGDTTYRLEKLRAYLRENF